ncbi:MAG: hypothetical protein AB1499_18815 [Nitrospirota bacterium]
MTAKDDKGKVIHTERRKFENWNLWFAGGKEVALRLWDITATTSVNMGIEPGQTSQDTHVLLLDPDTKSVTIEANFLFEPEPDKWEIIKTVTKTVNTHSTDIYFEKK